MKWSAAGVSLLHRSQRGRAITGFGNTGACPGEYVAADQAIGLMVIDDQYVRAGQARAGAAAGRRL